jgi:hypothetical protein
LEIAMIDQPPTDTEHQPGEMWDQGKQQEQRDRRDFRESSTFQTPTPYQIGADEEESE